MEIKEYDCYFSNDEYNTKEIKIIKSIPYDKEVDLDYTISIAEMMEECYNMSQMAEEHSYSICFDENKELIGVVLNSIGSEGNIHLDLNTISNRLVVLNCKYVVFIHNHPLYPPEPSKQDLTNYDFLKMYYKQHFVDSLIVGYDKEFCSINIFKDFDGLWRFDNKEEQEIEYILKKKEWR